MVAKLRRLADCLENGKQFKIQIAGERIQIPAKAVFNIEHEREGNAEEVEFQFKWERWADARWLGQVKILIIGCDSY